MSTDGAAPEISASRSALPPLWSRILREIVTGPEWQVRPKDLAARLDRVDNRGRMLESFSRTLERMERTCWLYRGEVLRREYVTLSEDARIRLGCELVQDGACGLRWTWNEPIDWPRSMRRPCGEDELDEFDVLGYVPDPQPGPDRLSELREAAEEQLAKFEQRARMVKRFSEAERLDLERLLPILVLIGSGTVWTEKGMRKQKPGAPWHPPRECETCKLLPLPKIGVCLRCLRWGWDEFFSEKRARRRA